MTEPVSEVFKEIVEYYDKLLNSPKKGLGEQEVLENLPREVGVYIIYKPNGECLYVGETANLRNRFKELMKFGHTLSWRLLKGRIAKSLNIDTYGFERKYQDKTGLEWGWGKKYEKTWKREEGNWKAVERFLKDCSFRYLVIERKKRGKTKLLERLLQVTLNPEIKDYKEGE
jgi:hypothetical protein